MARGQGQRRIGGKRAKHREIGEMPRYRAGQQRKMAFARDPVEDDAGERHLRTVAGEAAQQRSDRSALAAGIGDQNHRPAGEPGEFGGRPRLAIGPGAVEQAHDPFAQHDLGRALKAPDEPREGLGTHRPNIEIDARPAARCGVKGRIDEIGAGLGCGDANATPAQMPQQARCHQGLAAAGGWGGEDQPARLHARMCEIGIEYPDF